MFKYFTIFIFSVIFIFVGCSKKSDNSSNPIGGGLGGDLGGGDDNNSGVSFAIMHEVSANQDTVYFAFKPNANVKVTTINVNVANQQIDQDISNPDPTATLQKDQWYFFLYVDNVQLVVSGDVWKFTFTGTDANNKAFSVSTNYTIP